MEFLKQHSNEIKPLKINNNDNNITVDNIINEYSLKRNNFNPDGNSPNKFILKLEYRMKIYYNDLNNF
ncbi:MAG: hypothetical protein CBB97_08820 [Candidatus Endolissoclinum sp. TMED37]|nr:MAG: hypothetical protein CBB97_08820 [Candidatus Endolissoclinum sp. TMED37]